MLDAPSTSCSRDSSMRASRTLRAASIAFRAAARARISPVDLVTDRIASRLTNVLVGIPGVLGLRDHRHTARSGLRCTYFTTDALSGEHADLIMETTGDWIKAGFDSVANALKTPGRAIAGQTVKSGIPQTAP